MTDLLKRINQHLRQLSPQQRYREGMTLLVEARDVIERLRNDIEFTILQNKILQEYCRPVDISAAECDDRWPTQRQST